MQVFLQNYFNVMTINVLNINIPYTMMETGTNRLGFCQVKCRLRKVSTEGKRTKRSNLWMT